MRKQYRQGDVLLVQVDAVPADAASVAREKGRLVLAHGEATGHAHAIVDETAQLVTTEQLVSAEQAAELYLLVHGTSSVELVHEEHDAIAIPPGSYRVVRQREYSPEEIRRVAD